MNSLRGSLVLRKFVFNGLKESRRFAGHSKWANIKHVKAEEDMKRSMMIYQYIHKMKVAIQEGGSAKPTHNPKLASLITQAKRDCVPVSTINNFLEKVSKEKQLTRSAFLEIRGPGGCILLVELSTSNFVLSRNDVISKLKKFRAKLLEGGTKNVFDRIGVIIAEGKCNLDKAMEDALHIEADDVQELKSDENVYFQFTCTHDLLLKAKNQLEKLGYSIVSAEEDVVPNVFAELNEEDKKEVEKLCAKLGEMEVVKKIYTNIADSEEEQ